MFCVACGFPSCCCIGRLDAARLAKVPGRGLKGSSKQPKLTLKEKLLKWNDAREERLRKAEAAAAASASGATTGQESHPLHAPVDITSLRFVCLLNCVLGSWKFDVVLWFGCWSGYVCRCVYLYLAGASGLMA